MIMLIVNEVETERHVAVDGEGFDAPLPTKLFHKFEKLIRLSFYAHRDGSRSWMARFDRLTILKVSV